MAREFKGQPVDIHIFVSHTHWDHIQGFPFFVPAYIPGNRISIYSLRGTDKSLEKVFTGQMDSSYFPVELSDLRADLKFVELVGPQQVGPAIVNHIYLNHPGLAVGYRIQVGKKSVLYVTDHEPYSLLKGESDHSLKKDREIDDFAKGADLYIREAQYTDEEYPSKRSWGHATWSNVLEAAHSSRVKKLALFHHDPMHDDEFMDQVVAACQARIRERNMKFECFAASDSLEIRL
jgi:phosphoribosyl 1,2-cyclic phosphodiesterase